MDDVGAFVDARFIDDHRNLDLGGRNHLDVDPGFSQEIKHFSSDSRM